MRANFLEHHLRASLDWKTRDTGADRRKRDCLERVLLGPSERVARRRAQIRLRRRFSQPRTGGVNYVPRSQPARARNRRLAQSNRADTVALALNRRAALDPNRARDTAAQHQLIVCRIYDRIGVRLGKVALTEPDLRAPTYTHRYLMLGQTAKSRIDSVIIASPGKYPEAEALTVWTTETKARLLIAAQVMVALAALGGCVRYRAGRSPAMIQVDIEISPTSTDPRFATDATSSRIDELVFDSMVKADRNGQFVGRLAERIERPSSTRIVLHLKHGVRFSDGRELTARDILFTYNSILAPESMSPKRASLEELLSLEAPDAYTVVMTTAHPYAPALEMATEGIVPAGTPLPLQASAAAPIGSGPFQMASYTRDEAVRLERNPYYPHPPGAPQSILFKIVPDPTVRAL